MLSKQVKKLKFIISIIIYKLNLNLINLINQIKKYYIIKNDNKNIYFGADGYPDFR